MPETLRESEQNLKKLFDADATSSLAPVAPANSFADIFGLGSAAPKVTENPNITKYREILDTRSSPIPANPFGSIPGVSSIVPADSFGTRHDSFAPTPALGAIGLPSAPSF